MEKSSYTGDISPDEKWMFALENGKFQQKTGNNIIGLLKTKKNIDWISAGVGLMCLMVNNFVSTKFDIDENKMLIYNKDNKRRIFNRLAYIKVDGPLS